MNNFAIITQVDDDQGTLNQEESKEDKNEQVDKQEEEVENVEEDKKESESPCGGFLCMIVDLAKSSMCHEHSSCAPPHTPRTRALRHIFDAEPDSLPLNSQGHSPAAHQDLPELPP